MVGAQLWAWPALDGLLSRSAVLRLAALCRIGPMPCSVPCCAAPSCAALSSQHAVRHACAAHTAGQWDLFADSKEGLNPDGSAWGVPLSIEVREAQGSSSRGRGLGGKGRRRTSQLLCIQHLLLA